MSSLHMLPVELIQEISSYLYFPLDLISFCKTRLRIYHLCKPRLERHTELSQKAVSALKKGTWEEECNWLQLLIALSRDKGISIYVEAITQPLQDTREISAVREYSVNYDDASRIERLLGEHSVADIVGDQYAEAIRAWLKHGVVGSADASTYRKVMDTSWLVFPLLTLLLPNLKSASLGDASDIALPYMDGTMSGFIRMVRLAPAKQVFNQLTQVRMGLVEYHLFMTLICLPAVEKVYVEELENTTCIFETTACTACNSEEELPLSEASTITIWDIICSESDTVHFNHQLTQRLRGPCHVTYRVYAGRLGQSIRQDVNIPARNDPYQVH